MTSDHKKSHPEDDNYLYAASTSDMTGLTPTAATNEYEAESYEEIYPYFPPINPNGIVTVADIPLAEGIASNFKRKKNSSDEKRQND